MNTYTDKTPENRNRSMADAVSQKEQSGRGSIFQFADNRPETVAQRKLLEMPGDNARARQLRTFQQMGSNAPEATRWKAMADDHTAQKPQAILKNNDSSPDVAASRPGFWHVSGRNSPLKETQGTSNANLTIQRKEETDLKSGVFNMIGETHTDYPNDKFRKYESAQIKKKLGANNKYVTESQLKTRSSDEDFSDPLDLRVEQLVAFVRDGTPDLVSRLKSINLDLVSGEKEKEDAGAKKEAIKIIKDLIPRLQVETSTFQLKPILSELSKCSPAVLEVLKKSDVWLDVEFDEDLDTDPNFSENAARVQFGVEDLVGLEEPTEEQKETQKAYQGFVSTDGFFEQYKGRIPRTLKLYYELKSKDGYSTRGKYDFSINEIPYILDNWDKLGTLLGMFRIAFYKEDFVHLKTFVEIAALKLESIVDGMLAGAQGNKLAKTEEVVEKRSKKMHEAAQALAGSNIAWKVGDLHVKDIQKLESNRAIRETNYAYITKDNFKSKNFNEDDAKTYSGDAAIADETATNERIGHADEMIKGHQDGLNDAEEKVDASEEYKKGFRRGQEQLADEIKSPQASTTIQRWLQNARRENEWDKMKELCTKEGGKAAVLRAGLNMSDLDKMDPNFEITFEEEYKKYDPTKFFLWRWSHHVFVRKRFGIHQD